MITPLLLFLHSHNDLPMKMKRGANNKLTTFDLNELPPWDVTHTDIPRLRQGLVGAQVRPLYVVRPCTEWSQEAYTFSKACFLNAKDIREDIFTFC